MTSTCSTCPLRLGSPSSPRAPALLLAPTTLLPSLTTNCTSLVASLPIVPPPTTAGSTTLGTHHGHRSRSRVFWAALWAQPHRSSTRIKSSWSVVSSVRLASSVTPPTTVANSSTSTLTQSALSSTSPFRSLTAKRQTMERQPLAISS